MDSNGAEGISDGHPLMSTGALRCNMAGGSGVCVVGEDAG